MALRNISGKTALWIAAIFVILSCLAGGLYIAAQNLTTRVVRAQLQQAGFKAATVEGVRLYLDGIVIGRIALTPHDVLYDVFTPQTPPDIARNGLRHLIVKRWQQHVAAIDPAVTVWPFPRLETLSVEDMQLKLALPLRDILLQGTVKSLRPEAGLLALILPFEMQEEAYTAQGKIGLNIEQGRVTSIDVDLEDGSFQDAANGLSLKRMSGWLNASLWPDQPAEMQAQFMAGSVLYQGETYADGMVQYSQNGADATEQWTVTLNRPADEYYNTGVIEPVVIEPVKDHRYVVRTAAQRGAKSKQDVMVSGAPLRLEPLLREK